MSRLIRASRVAPARLKSFVGLLKAVMSRATLLRLSKALPIGMESLLVGMRRFILEMESLLPV